MQSHIISSHRSRRERRPPVGLDEDSYPTIYLYPSLFKQRSRPSLPAREQVYKLSPFRPEIKWREVGDAESSATGTGSGGAGMLSPSRPPVNPLNPDIFRPRPPRKFARK